MKKFLFYSSILFYILVSSTYLLQIAQHYSLDILEFFLTLPYIFVLPFAVLISAFIQVFYLAIFIWLDPLITILVLRKSGSPNLLYAKYALMLVTVLLFVWSMRLTFSTVNEYIDNGKPRCSFENQPLLPPNNEYFPPDKLAPLQKQCEMMQNCTIKYNEYVSFGDADQSGPTWLACCPTDLAELLFQKDGKRLYPECLPPGFDDN